MEQMKPAFEAFGPSLDTFVVDNASLPDELQQTLAQRISMNMLGDMNKLTQFQVAKSIPIAAANEGGGVAGIGVGLGAGLTMGQQMMNAMSQGQQGPQGPQTGWGGGGAPQAPQGPQTPPPAPVVPQGGPAPQNDGPSAAGALKFCMNCGHQIPRAAKFCAECGTAQQ